MLAPPSLLLAVAVPLLDVVARAAVPPLLALATLRGLKQSEGRPHHGVPLRHCALSVVANLNIKVSVGCMLQVGHDCARDGVNTHFPSKSFILQELEVVKEVQRKHIREMKDDKE
ncbi:hypothetical protein EJB05_13771, partial [Eragrostis curvula]